MLKMLLSALLGFALVLLWLYVSSWALLLGAELNAEIGKMWPLPARDSSSTQPAEEPVIMPPPEHATEESSP